MKKLFIIISISILCMLAMQQASAQVPEKIDYQAVVRNSSNELVVSQAIGVKVTILQDSINGSVVYSETQAATTNINGLFTLEIGGGAVITGSISKIEWANGPFFIQTEIDPEGGTNYSIAGISQLMSVPYALHAKAADALDGTLIKVNAQNEWINLLKIGKDLLGCWTILARAHDLSYTEKYAEWRLIVGDKSDANTNVYYEQLSNFGNAIGAIELRVSEGYVQGRWTGKVGGGPFCYFKLLFVSFRIPK